MVRLAAVIAQRCWSERLPGKALAKVAGRPILAHLIERYRSCERVTDVIVATSPKPEDGGIAALCEAEGVPCYRGGESTAGDVVGLLNAALELYAPTADYVFRGMGDCPLFEPGLIDWFLDVLVRTGGDLVWVGLPDDLWPIYGARESPWSRAAWDACMENSEGEQREHAGSWIYENLRFFRVVNVTWLRDEYYRPYRLELDTEADLQVIRAVVEGIGIGQPTMLEAIKWLDAHPEVAQINAGVELKSITKPNWRRRGVAWVCQECGAPAPAMHALTIRRKALETQCVRCGAVRKFVEVPAFLAREAEDG